MALYLRQTTGTDVAIPKLNESLLNNDCLNVTPRILFKTYTFERKIVTDEKEIGSLNWKEATLVINDGISGGTTRSVDVLFFSNNDTTYIKAIKKLEKNEFEILFGFNCGSFIPGRIISVSSHILDVV
tara:strand:- start:5358 stop:5741 length:384 start_codon:yes stop_codon:yes gene_type:complete